MTEYWDGTGVSIQALKAEVIKLAEEFPDRITKCVYSNADREPVCIVGTAIFNITGKAVDDRGRFCSQLCVSSNWRAALSATSFQDDEAFDFVARVQSHQDRGETWGSALKYAK